MDDQHTSLRQSNNVKSEKYMRWISIKNDVGAITKSFSVTLGEHRMQTFQQTSVNVTHMIKMYISRWQTLIAAVLLLLSGKLGWVEMSHIPRYIILQLHQGLSLFCHTVKADILCIYTYVYICFHVVSQICSSFLASRLPSVCRQHLCWFQGFVTHSKSSSFFACPDTVLPCTLTSC